MTYTRQPLSRERRIEIENIIGRENLSRECFEAFSELALAESYWREAVRESYEYIDESDGMHAPECQYCNGKWISTLNAAPGTEARLEHTDDCAWKKAQE